MAFKSPKKRTTAWLRVMHIKLSTEAPLAFILIILMKMSWKSMKQVGHVI